MAEPEILATGTLLDEFPEAEWQRFGERLTPEERAEIVGARSGEVVFVRSTSRLLEIVETIRPP